MCSSPSSCHPRRRVGKSPSGRIADPPRRKSRLAIGLNPSPQEDFLIGRVVSEHGFRRGVEPQRKANTWITEGTAAVWALGSAQACKSDDPSSPSGTGGTVGHGDGDGDGDETGGTGGTSTGGFTSTRGSAQVFPCDLEGADLKSLPYDISEDFYYVNEIPEGVSAARVVEDASCDDANGNAGGAG